MKKAIIYVRGNDTSAQEIFCRFYASDIGYKVLYVTSDMKDVNLCDVLLVSSLSRISRDRIKYIEIVNHLNKKGIEIVSAVNHDNAVDNLSLARYILK